jgi:hypothetical protein
MGFGFCARYVFALANINGDGDYFSVIFFLEVLD